MATQAPGQGGKRNDWPPQISAMTAATRSGSRAGMEAWKIMVVLGG
jgi:hypothetical protein